MNIKQQIENYIWDFKDRLYDMKPGVLKWLGSKFINWYERQTDD